MPWFGRSRSRRKSEFVRPQGERLEPRVTLSRVPVLFVPGQPASLPRDVINDLNASRFVQAGIKLNSFLMQVGTHPAKLTTEFTVKPLGVTSPSNPLLQSLRNVGYRDGVDLFAAVHDWRMPVAPPDGVDDGFLANVTADLMTSGQFDYGVGYLGYWLEKAEAAWLADPTNTGAFPGVNFISHSEGNLLVRAYVSSAAYLDPSMPKVNTWVAAAPPFQGASGIYNLLANNFANPLGSDVTGGGLYPFVELPYVQVASFGGTVAGPDGVPLITRASINDPLTGKPDPYRFMQQYIPSLWSENATYAFLDGHTVNDDPRFRNDLLLDLNWTALGAVSTAFVSQLDTFAVVYGTKKGTLTSAVTQPPAFIKPVLPLIAGFGDVLGMFAYKPWVKDVSIPFNGDGFIPVMSAVPPSFVGNPSIHLLPQTFNVDGQPADHDDMISDPKSIKSILGQLGYTVSLVAAKKAPKVTPTQRGLMTMAFPLGVMPVRVRGVNGSGNLPTAHQMAKIFAAFAGQVSPGIKLLGGQGVKPTAFIRSASSV